MNVLGVVKLKFAENYCSSGKSWTPVSPEAAVLKV
jgi:hypothetical protein